MQEKYGFVYLWRDRKHKRYYVGSHWGTENDGYICSSRWMRKAYKRRPNDFKRRTISIVKNREELSEEEHRFLQMIREDELKIKYYNIRNNHFGHWSEDEKRRVEISNTCAWSKGLTKETDERLAKIADTLSKTLKGRDTRAEGGSKWTGEQRQAVGERSKKLFPNGPWAGKKHSDETKRKISKSKKGRCGGENHPMFGKKHSEESREKMRRSRLAYLEKQKHERTTE